MATIKQKVIKLAEELGATVEAASDETRFIIEVEAPPGHHWTDAQLHEMVSTQFKGFDTKECWADILERMKCGTEPCHSGCEWWE